MPVFYSYSYVGDRNDMLVRADSVRVPSSAAVLACPSPSPSPFPLAAVAVKLIAEATAKARAGIPNLGQHAPPFFPSGQHYVQDKVFIGLDQTPEEFHLNEKLQGPGVGGVGHGSGGVGWSRGEIGWKMLSACPLVISTHHSQKMQSYCFLPHFRVTVFCLTSTFCPELIF